MKKLFFIFFKFLIFSNVSHASFPVSDTLKLNQKTLKTEEIKQYHSSLIKMGIDLNDCRCERCRAGIPISVELINQNAKVPIDYVQLQKNISKIFLVTGAVGLIVMLHGIFHVREIGSGIGGLFVLLASIILLLINILLKKIKRKK